jgi:heme-degrading monooxygenase HmoA
MVVVVFRSRVREERAEEYSRRADEMWQIAKAMPGFISYKSFTAPDGERVSIHEWESAEELKAWREHPEHRRMQAFGRQEFYNEYTLYVCDSPRESRFESPKRGS